MVASTPSSVTSVSYMYFYCWNNGIVFTNLSSKMWVPHLCPLCNQPPDHCLAHKTYSINVHWIENWHKENLDQENNESITAVK